MICWRASTGDCRSGHGGLRRRAERLGSRRLTLLMLKLAIFTLYPDERTLEARPATPVRLSSLRSPSPMHRQATQGLGPSGGRSFAQATRLDRPPEFDLTLIDAAYSPLQSSRSPSGWMASPTSKMSGCLRSIATEHSARGGWTISRFAERFRNMGSRASVM